VFKTQGFTEISDEALIYILKSNKLLMDEIDILKKVTEWGTVNAVSQAKSLKYEIVWVCWLGCDRIITR